MWKEKGDDLFMIKLLRLTLTNANFPTVGAVWTGLVDAEDSGQGIHLQMILYGEIK